MSWLSAALTVGLKCEDLLCCQQPQINHDLVFAVTKNNLKRDRNRHDESGEPVCGVNSTWGNVATCWITVTDRLRLFAGLFHSRRQNKDGLRIRDMVMALLSSLNSWLASVKLELFWNEAQHHPGQITVTSHTARIRDTQVAAADNVLVSHFVI